MIYLFSNFKMVAATIVAIFCFQSYSFGLSEKEANNIERVIKEIKLKAQEGNIKDAIEEAEKALSSNSFSVKSNKKIIDLEQIISKQFLSQNTQSIFEIAESLYWNGQIVEAHKKYLEAQSLEPHNALIIEGVVRSKIYLGNCQEAVQIGEEIVRLRPFEHPLVFLTWRAHLCLDTKDSTIKFLTSLNLEELKKINKIAFIWLYKLSEDFIDLDNLKHKESFAGLEQISFPELTFLEFKKEPENDLKKSLGLKYLSECKSINNVQKRNYYFEPKLCAAMKLVEEEMVD